MGSMEGEQDEIEMNNTGVIKCDADMAEELEMTKKRWLTLMKTIGAPDNPAAIVSHIFYVKLDCNSFATRQSCDVYGEINIVDKDHKFYQIYGVDPSEAETITPEYNSLSIYIPEVCSFSDWASIHMTLKDRFDDSVIIDKVFKLAKETELVDYDKVKSYKINGVGGSAFVSYVVFSTAVVAYVDIILIESETCDPFLGPPDLCGTIVARYGNTYGKQFPSIMLFKKLSASQTPVAETPVELCEELVAVPMYSFLQIDIDLFDSYTHQPFVKDKVEFLGRSRSFSRDDIRTKDYVLRLNIQWLHPYVLETPLKVTRPKTSSKFQIPSNERVGLALLSSLRFKYTLLGSTLVEVFAIMICRNSNNRNLKLWGKVCIENTLLFNRDKSNADPSFFSSNSETKVIPVKGPAHCYMGPEGFAIGINLQDDQDEVFIKGSVEWNEHSIERPISWYDRRICSVYPGLQAYASVFYTIFSSAAQASVKVLFKSKGSEDISYSLHGKIIASYSNKDYSTKYDRTYYRSVMFEESKIKPAIVKSNSTVSLLKSVVAVPTDSSLIVEVDLNASSDGILEEHLEFVPKFAIDPSAPTSSVFTGENYTITLSVEWSGVVCCKEEVW